MPTEKDVQFLTFVFDNTSNGKLHWEATADPTKFVVSFKGKYKVTVDRADDDQGNYNYWLTLFDESDRELLLLSSPRSSIKELYELAKRTSLNTDSVLDEIMRSDLDDDKPASSSPITDEDIPF